MGLIGHIEQIGRMGWGWIAPSGLLYCRPFSQGVALGSVGSPRWGYQPLRVGRLLQQLIWINFYEA